MLIADDDPGFCAWVAATTGESPVLEIVGVAHTGDDAVAMASALDPDVILMDVRMPCSDGIDATRRIRAGGCTAGIVVLTGSDSGGIARAAYDAGATAFVRKDAAMASAGSGPLDLVAFAAMAAGRSRPHAETSKA